MGKKLTRLPHKNVYARLKSSAIHGVGVFAIRPIPKGSYIFANDDEELLWISARELRGLDAEQRRLYDDFCIIRGDLYGCPRDFNKLTPSWYFNESDSPNVACDENFRFFARRHIRKGEELTFDYDTYSDRPHSEKRRKPNGQLAVPSSQSRKKIKR